MQVKIRRNNPRYADLTQGATLDAKAIQNLLDDETVLLEYKLGDRRSYLWLVSKNALKIYHSAEPRSKSKKRRVNITTRLFRAIKQRINSAAELSAKLGQMLLAPVAFEIENKRLAIVADGFLQFVPFSALKIQNSKLKTQNFLVETNEIVVLPSASVLAELRQNDNQTNRRRKLWRFSPIRFLNRTTPGFRALSKNVKPNEKPSEIGKVLRDFNFGETLPRLLSSRIEAKNISAFTAEKSNGFEYRFRREPRKRDERGFIRLPHFAFCDARISRHGSSRIIRFGFVAL